METKGKENFLIHVMNSGFERAAMSFSQLIRRPVKIVNSQSILVRHDDDFSYISEEQGDLNILVTQIVGDITGKSFLIFNKEESQEIFRALYPLVLNDSLNETFLLEIDNIISAAVIAELANALGLDIYGNVPQLAKIHSRDLESFMNAEVDKNDPSSLIFCNTTFQFDKRERIHPQFLWKLSSKVFQMIPSDKITV